MKRLALLITIVLIALTLGGCVSSQEQVKPADRSLSYQNADAARQGAEWFVALLGLVGQIGNLPEGAVALVGKIQQAFKDIGLNSHQQLANWGGVEKMPAEDKQPYSPIESKGKREESKEQHKEGGAFYGLIAAGGLAVLQAARMYGRSIPVVGPLVGWVLDRVAKGSGNGARTNEQIADRLQVAIDDVKEGIPEVAIRLLREAIPDGIEDKIPPEQRDKLLLQLERIIAKQTGPLTDAVKQYVNKRVQSILGDKLLPANDNLLDGALT